MKLGPRIDLIKYPRRTWTGGDTPPPGLAHESEAYRSIRSFYFQEALVECGGLDLWKCAGTGSMERARIFWNRASLDAWRTLTETR